MGDEGNKEQAEQNMVLHRGPLWLGKGSVQLEAIKRLQNRM